MSSKSASSPLHSARTSHGIYTLGVTGGIGSGKSYIARLLEERGIPVYDTDSRAKALYDTDGELREAMISLCGAGIYAPSGLLDRKALASLWSKSMPSYIPLCVATLSLGVKDSAQKGNACVP